MVQKINWFRRLFFSWNDLTRHFQETEKVAQNNALNNENINENIVLKEQVKSFAKFEAQAAALKQMQEQEVQRLTHELKSLNDSLTTHQIQKTQNEKIAAAKMLELTKLQQALESSKAHTKELEQSIYKRLQPLQKIDETFFGKSGNKGKGMLGEMQLGTILVKSGLPNDFWTTNLMVGQNQVEYAIKSGQTTTDQKQQKWIPIDSKVLDHKSDQNNFIIIDKTYRDRVLVQAKEVSKYLNKANTTEYGLLVLQNDAIYIELYDQFPALFSQAIEKYKIYITAPSMFINFSWTISHILEIYKKVHAEESIYDKAFDVVTTVTKFGASLKDTYDSFKIAMENHYPLVAKRQNALIKLVNKNATLKPLNQIDEKGKYAKKELLFQTEGIS